MRRPCHVATLTLHEAHPREAALVLTRGVSATLGTVVWQDGWWYSSKGSACGRINGSRSATSSLAMLIRAQARHIAEVLLEDRQMPTESFTIETDLEPDEVKRRLEPRLAQIASSLGLVGEWDEGIYSCRGHGVAAVATIRRGGIEVAIAVPVIFAGVAKQLVREVTEQVEAALAAEEE